MYCKITELIDIYYLIEELFLVWSNVSSKVEMKCSLNTSIYFVFYVSNMLIMRHYIKHEYPDRTPFSPFNSLNMYEKWNRFNDTGTTSNNNKATRSKKHIDTKRKTQMIRKTYLKWIKSAKVQAHTFWFGLKKISV